MPKFDKYLENLWNRYTKDLAEVLIFTGVAGWTLSSAGQIVGLLANDNITNKEKTFLIPQEIFDACVNIGSFYLVTQGLKRFVSKMVTTGKLAPASIRNYLKNSPFKNSVGKTDFNIERDLKGLVSFNEHMDTYTSFKNLVTTTGTIGASVLSCNIITPVLRNTLASYSHNTLVKNANEGKNTIFTKEELENKDSKVLQYKPNLYKIPSQSRMKV